MVPDGMHDDDGFQGEPRVISTAGTTIEKWMRRGGYVILVQNKRKKTWRSLQRNNVNVTATELPYLSAVNPLIAYNLD